MVPGATLALVLTAACASGPRYDPVPADLCEDAVPLLADLRVRFQVTLQDDSIYRHLDAGPGESTHCYFRLSNPSTFVALLVVAHTYPSLEDADDSYQTARGNASARGYESVGTVDDVGEEAAAYLRALDSGGPTLYELVSRDRNLSLLMGLEISDDRHPTGEALADLMHPLAREVLDLLPQS